MGLAKKERKQEAGARVDARGRKKAPDTSSLQNELLRLHCEKLIYYCNADQGNISFVGEVRTRYVMEVYGGLLYMYAVSLALVSLPVITMHGIYKMQQSFKIVSACFTYCKCAHRQILLVLAHYF